MKYFIEIQVCPNCDRKVEREAGAPELRTSYHICQVEAKDRKDAIRKAAKKVVMANHRGFEPDRIIL